MSNLESSKDRIEEGYRRFYATCGEIPKQVSNPYFVKVGANDGLTGDPCSKLLLAEASWHGCLIEPVPYLYDRLEQNFSDASRFRLVQAAIGKEVSSTTFYFVDPKALDALPELPHWYDKIGGLSRDHLTKHLGEKINPFIMEMNVPVVPLSKLLPSNDVESVELLHVDVEGHDFEVVKSIDFNEHQPLSMLVEQKHLSAEDRLAMVEFLADRDYHTFPFGGEVFALCRNAPDALLRAAGFIN